MNKEEQTRYLANIYHLLISDGSVDRIEEKVFDEIAREIGAGYFEKRNAMDLAGKGGYQVQLAGRWSERIRNLEDMLFAAYCNDVLERTEKKVITHYAGQVGINQAQFDVIKEETKQRYMEYKGKAT
jgi:uncharacterized tellurite resistance protein B-like protein